MRGVYPGDGGTKVIACNSIEFLISVECLTVPQTGLEVCTLAVCFSPDLNRFATDVPK